MKELTSILSKLVLIFFLFIACEEYYKPDLEVVPGLLVVESHLTNDPNQNFVRLTMTKDFYNTSLEEKIVGAQVELFELGDLSTKGIESGTGYFTFPKTPVAGQRYVLRISYKSDVYESEVVVMPPLPTIDTLYTAHKIEKEYRTDAYGVPSAFEVPGREIEIDAPITQTLGHYRFTWRAILQWVYNPPGQPSKYGWISRYDEGNFNLAGPKEFSVSDKVTKHSILSLAYDSWAYLPLDDLIPVGWIVIIDQYGITKESFDFHTRLNLQLSADGSLFEPVLSQVYGNIRCINDPSKIVLGFFDLNSYRQYRYFINPGINEESRVILWQINWYPDIPDEGNMLDARPSFWE